MTDVYFILPSASNGGAENQLLEFALDLLEDISFDVNIICLKSNGPLFSKFSKFGKCFLFNSQSLTSSLKSLNSVITNNSYVITSHHRTSLMASVLILFKQNVKLISRIPSNFFEESKDSFFPLFFKLYIYLSYVFSYRLIAQTPFQLDQINSFFKFPHKDVYHSNNIISYKSNSDFKRDDFFSDQFINISWVGRLDSNKRCSLAISSVFAAFGKRAFLHILGHDNGQLTTCRKLALDIGFSNIKFYGSVTNTTDFIKNSDIFLHTSVHEACPNSLLEAYSLNIPIVATYSSPLLTDIIDRNNGIVVFSIDHLADSLIEASQLPRDVIDNKWTNGSLRKIIE